MKTTNKYYYPELAEKAMSIKDSQDIFIMIGILSDIRKKLFGSQKEELDYYLLIYVNLLDDFLYNTIEENYYDLEALKEPILYLKELLLAILMDTDEKKKSQQISQYLKKYFNSYKNIIKMSELPRKDIILQSARESDELALPIKLCHFSSPFVVGGFEMPFALIFDELICDPEFNKKIIESLYRVLNEISNFDKICFIEKRFGPVGALSVMSSIVHKVNKKAFIYRPGHWDKHAKVYGKAPEKGDNVVIIYDLVLTGRSVRETIKFIKNNYGASVTYAVVVYNYRGLKKIENAKIKSLFHNPMKELEKKMVDKYREEMESLRKKWESNEIKDLSDYKNEVINTFGEYAGIKFFIDSKNNL